MELSNQKIKQAEDMIAFARKFIMRNQSFLATLMLGLKFERIDDPDMTMCTDGAFLKWSPHFVLEGGQAKAVFVVIHEICHVVFKHHLRRGKRDPRIFNDAADYVINCFITLMGLTNTWTTDDLRKVDREWVMRYADFIRPEYKMPEDGLFDPKFAGMGTEEVYNLLVQKEEEEGNTSGEGPQDGDPNPNGKCPWGDVIDGTNDEGEALSAEELIDAERELTQAIKTAENIAKGRGQMVGGCADMLGDLDAPSQDWRDILRDLMQDTVPNDFSFARPNRLYGGDLVMPSIDKEGMGTIGIFTDASGSVSQGEFKQFMSDVSDICDELNPERVVHIQFDWDAREHEEIEQGDEPELVRRHSGGTRFSAPFEYATKADLMDDFDVIIVFTDGGDDQYPVEPDCPVIWASTGAFFRGDPPFGDCVQVKFNH
mgnify:CR=1 FL=1